MTSSGCSNVNNPTANIASVDHGATSRRPSLQLVPAELLQQLKTLQRLPQSIRTMFARRPAQPESFSSRYGAGKSQKTKKSFKEVSISRNLQRTDSVRSPSSKHTTSPSTGRYVSHSNLRRSNTDEVKHPHISDHYYMCWSRTTTFRWPRRYTVSVTIL